jgi:tagatose-1,6-bisphosphate aldolase non-catalytic subunit AgaZ/GatZ
MDKPPSDLQVKLTFACRREWNRNRSIYRRNIRVQTRKGRDILETSIFHSSSPSWTRHVADDTVRNITTLLSSGSDAVQYYRTSPKIKNNVKVVNRASACSAYSSIPEDGSHMVLRNVG